MSTLSNLEIAALAQTSSPDLAAALATRLIRGGCIGLPGIKAELPCAWVLTQIEESEVLRTWALQQIRSEETQLAILDRYLEDEAILEELASSPHLTPKAKTRLLAAVPEAAFVDFDKKDSFTEPKLSNEKADPPLDRYSRTAQLLGDVEQTNNVRLSGSRATELLCQYYQTPLYDTLPYTTDQVLCALQPTTWATPPYSAAKLLISTPEAAARAVVLNLLTDLYHHNPVRRVGPELLAVMITIPHFAPVTLDYRTADVFTDEVIDVLLASPAYSLLYGHRLSDTQYTAMLERLDPSDLWYGAKLVCSRTQVAIFLTKWAHCHNPLKGSMPVSGEHLARWLTGVDDPLLPEVLAADNLADYQEYALGTWRCVNEYPLLPANIDATLVLANVDLTNHDTILETVGSIAPDLAPYHYEVLMRLPRGHDVISSTADEALAGIWNYVEDQCADPLAFIDMLVRSDASLQQVLATLRRARTPLIPTPHLVSA